MNTAMPRLSADDISTCPSIFWIHSTRCFCNNRFKINLFAHVCNLKAALVSTLSVFRLRKFAKVLGAARQGIERVPGQEVAESTSHTILPRNALDKQKRGERCTCTTAKPQGR